MIDIVARDLRESADLLLAMARKARENGDTALADWLTARAAEYLDKIAAAKEQQKLDTK